MRQLCGDIVREKKANIGSHPDFGFFIIEDNDDYDLAQRNLKSRVSEIAERVHAIDEMWEERRRLQYGQARHIGQKIERRGKMNFTRKANLWGHSWTDL